MWGIEWGIRGEKEKGLRISPQLLVFLGGPSAPEGGTPGSAFYYGSGAGGPRYTNGGMLFVAVPAGFEPAFSP